MTRTFTDIFSGEILLLSLWEKGETEINKFMLICIVVIGVMIYSFLKNKFLLYSMPKIFLFKYDKNLHYLSLKCWDIWNVT